MGLGSRRGVVNRGEPGGRGVRGGDVVSERRWNDNGAG